MSTKELAASRAEFKELLEQMSCDELIYIEGDTKVQRETEVEDFSDVGYKVHGRGITNFDEIFSRIKELSPDVVLCFTDMQPCSWPEDPGVETIWLRTCNIDAPFGRYVDLFRGNYDSA
jgi:predicted metal-dependent peptidase